MGCAPDRFGDDRHSLRDLCADLFSAENRSAGMICASHYDRRYPCRGRVFCDPGKHHRTDRSLAIR